MRRGRLRAVAGAVLAAAIAVSAAGAANVAQAGNVTLQFWTIQLKPTFDNYINGLIYGFEKLHPGVTVKWTDLPIGTIEQKMLAAEAAGQSPDVVNLNTGFAIAMALQGALTPIDTVTTAKELSMYVPTILNSTRIGHHIYAFPWYMGSTLLIYNRALFQKAGLDPNKPPKNIQEEFRDATIIHNKLHIYGIYDAPDQGIAQIAAYYGIPFIKNNKAEFATPEMAKLLGMYAQGYKSGALTPAVLSNNYYQALQQYESGQLAMILTGPQFLRFIKKDGPTVYKTTDVALPPMGSAKVLEAAAMDLVIPAKSQHKREAAQFALWVTNDEHQLMFDELVPIFPSTRKAIYSSFFRKNLKTLTGKATYLGAIVQKYGEDIQVGTSDPTDVSSAISAAWQAALLGKMSPMAALKQAAQTIDQVLAQHRR